jgi:hypothetical protein
LLRLKRLRVPGQIDPRHSHDDNLAQRCTGPKGFSRSEHEDVPSSVELRWRPGEHQAALT